MAFFSALPRLSHGLRMSVMALALCTMAMGSELAAGEAVKPTVKAKNKIANNDMHDPKAVSGGGIILPVRSMPGNVNYIVNNEGTVGGIWDYCVDTLGTRHLIDVNRFEPLLAERWSVSEDGLTYTIHLRKGVKWQAYIDPITKEKVAARDVTSDDFIFYWNTIQNQKVPCDPIRSGYKLMKGLEKIDAYSFRVIWREPYSLAEERVLGMMPLPKHYYRPDPTWDDAKFAAEMMTSTRNQFMISCGRYRLDKWEKGKHLTLLANPNYYGTKPAITRIVYQVVTDPNVQLLEFKKGNLDRMGLTPDQWTRETNDADFITVTDDPETAIVDSWQHDQDKKADDLPEEYKFEKFQYKRFVWYYIGYNIRKPMFSSRATRTAMTHIIDRKRILKEVYLDFGQVITGPFVPQSPYYNKDIKPIPFDLTKAKVILTKEGWTDSDGDGWLDKDLGNGKRTRFEFTFMAISNSTLQEKFTAIIQEDMKKVGIKMNIKPVEWSVYTERLAEWAFDVCSLGWGGGIESDPYQIWHSSQAKLKKSSNHVGYQSAEADKLIEAGRRTLDLTKRIEIYKKFHAVLNRDQPYTFMICPSALVAQNKRYRNARVYVTGMDSSLMWVPKAMQIRTK